MNKWIEQAKRDLGHIGAEEFMFLVEEIEINMGRHSVAAKAYRKVRDER